MLEAEATNDIQDLAPNLPSSSKRNAKKIYHCTAFKIFCATVCLKKKSFSRNSKQNTDVLNVSDLD